MKAVCALTLLACSLFAQAPVRSTVWAPKPDKTPHYISPHKPLTKLADVKAAHAGKANWRQLVVDDNILHCEWISAAPGTKEPKVLHPDTRTFWIIQEGQIRFNIEGQEPFTASKGWIVQVPFQTFFSVETVGDKPSLRYEVNVGHAHTLYAEEKDAPPMEGYHWMPVKMARKPGMYEHDNKPYRTYDDLAKLSEEHHAPSHVIWDDRMVGNFLYGYGSKLPPIDETDVGHYHPESCESWFIMSGEIRYKIEGVGVFIAHPGDVVYVPPFTFHAPRWYGEGPSCRFAMNGYPEIAHLFEK
jgi:mannose-6-phosphate isomerase-like protein (cupin superfamily)